MGDCLMLELNKLAVGYQQRAVTPPITGSFARGSMTALVGANGCGKSTLLKTLCAMQPPISGSMVFPQGRPSIAWLPQQADIEKNFPITVFDLVATGFWRLCGWLRGINRQQRLQVNAALERVNMCAFADAAPGALSGGQLQRVLFARMLIQDAALLLLDEPFSGVDSDSVALLMALLKERHRAGCTLIVVLHDRAAVDAHFPEVLRLGEQRYQWLSARCRDTEAHSRLDEVRAL